MNNTSTILFHSAATGWISIDKVMDEVKSFVAREPARMYQVIVGTDSRASDRTRMVTAITVRRVGNGAIYFWTRSEEKIFHSFRDRIWDEAISSITLGQEVRSRLKDKLGDEFFWDGNEIHVDIGRAGITREMVDAVVGMIKGYQFQPVIKPHAFGASSVADRHT